MYLFVCQGKGKQAEVVILQKRKVAMEKEIGR